MNDDNDRLWFWSSDIPDGFLEAVNYPVARPDGEMYMYYWDGKRFIDTRFMDSQSVGGVKIDYGNTTQK